MFRPLRRTFSWKQGRTVHVLLLEHVAGKDLRYFCSQGEVVTNYLPFDKHRDAIFATFFRLNYGFHQP